MWWLLCDHVKPRLDIIQGLPAGAKKRRQWEGQRIVPFEKPTIIIVATNLYFSSMPCIRQWCFLSTPGAPVCPCLATWSHGVGTRAPHPPAPLKVQSSRMHICLGPCRRYAAGCLDLLCPGSGYMLHIDLSMWWLTGEVSSYNWGMAPCQFSKWISKHRQILLFSGYSLLVVPSLALGSFLSRVGR